MKLKCKRHGRWVALASMAIACVSPAAHAATPDEIDAAIAKAVTFLYANQNAGGHWDSPDAPTREQMISSPITVAGGQWGGTSALVTYALLAAGEPGTDPRVTRAVNFLRGADLIGHYAIGLRAQVWINLPPSKDVRAAMDKDSKLLITGQSRLPENLGLYTYLPTPLMNGGSTYSDLSCSQYGVLGAWAAAQLTDDFSKAYWTTVETAWRQRQQPDGSWRYEAGGPLAPSVTMTLAALATLYITQQYVHADAGMNGGGNVVDPALDKGMAYVAANLSPILEGGAPHRGYALYGVERVGVASGFKYINGLDWYARGADALVRTQTKDGAWEGLGESNVIDTAFALLFLTRGRAPVMMNKLQYASVQPDGSTLPGKWNQRPRDVANATHWVGKETERTLNWQIIDLSVATVADLHDSPVLYISGDTDLNLSDEDKAKIKQFVEEGGMVFGNADVGRAGFTKAFEALGTELFPAYQFEPVPDKHPLYAGEAFMASKWAKQPDAALLSNGTRVLFLRVGKDDFGKAWQRNNTKATAEAFQFMANVFLYSVDKQNPRVKGRTHVVAVDPVAPTTRSLKIARLQYDGNWDPEPGGWRRIAALMNNRDKVALNIFPAEITNEGLKGFDVAHLTGTTSFSLTVAQREALKKFSTAGGVIIVDAAGGSADFAQAAEKELATIFTSQAAALKVGIREDSLLLKPDNKTKLEVKYRDYALTRMKNDIGRFDLKGIEKDGSAALIFSPVDLSSGMVGNSIDGIIGYTPDTATRLMRTLLFKIARAKQPTPNAPASQPVKTP